MSLLDGVSLGQELFAKKYLHPAIISACKNLDELNVYLDCLDKNELDDFRIFQIKYEISPVILKNDEGLNILRKIKRFFMKNVFSEN